MTPLQKLTENVGNLGKIILAKALKNCPKCNKSPNLVTLIITLVSSPAYLIDSPFL